MSGVPWGPRPGGRGPCPVHSALAQAALPSPTTHSTKRLLLQAARDHLETGVWGLRGTLAWPWATYLVLLRSLVAAQAGGPKGQWPVWTNSPRKPTEPHSSPAFPSGWCHRPWIRRPAATHSRWSLCLRRDQALPPEPCDPDSCPPALCGPRWGRGSGEQGAAGLGGGCALQGPLPRGFLLLADLCPSRRRHLEPAALRGG